MSTYKENQDFIIRIGEDGALAWKELVELDPEEPDQWVDMIYAVYGAFARQLGEDVYLEVDQDKDVNGWRWLPQTINVD